MRLSLLFLSLLAFFTTQGQPSDARLLNAINDLKEFVAIPNFGLNSTDIDKNIQWVDEAFRQRRFDTQILKTEGNPLFFAEQKINPELPTLLFYMHLDGQAVDRSKWDQDHPYHAVLKKKGENREWIEMEWSTLNNEIDPEWRIFGRSASDDKGPIIAFLHAYDALIAESKTPKYNIKVVLDAEEEIGSTSLEKAVKQYRSILDADGLIINDGPVHPSGSPTLTFGCRGIMTLNMTVYGPIKPQHSGHYGNYAPNPIFRLSKLLSSMKDDNGKVLIKGYYDGIVLSDETKNILASVPDDEETIQDVLQIAEAEKVGTNYQESLQYPSLNARGISSAWVGAQARTIVPDNATVAIDMRLVPESDPDRLLAAIKNHIEGQGYHIVDHEPTYEERKLHPKVLFLYAGGATLPFRTDMDSPLGQWLEKTIKTEYQIDPVKIRIMGGTVPISSFINELAIPAIIVPMVNPDNNQHSPNENMRIGLLRAAIRTFSAIMTTDGLEKE